MKVKILHLALAATFPQMSYDGVAWNIVTGSADKESCNKLIQSEIQNSQELNSQQKTILISYIGKTTQLIPLLTNEDLLEIETQQKIDYEF